MASLMTAGAALAVYPSYFALLAGRLLYGFANESLTIVQGCILTQWFNFDRRITLTLACTISLAASRLGGVIAMVILPGLSDISLFWAGVMVSCMTSLSLMSGKMPWTARVTHLHCQTH